MAGLSRFALKQNKRLRRLCHSHIQIHNVVSDSESETKNWRNISDRSQTQGMDDLPTEEFKVVSHFNIFFSIFALFLKNVTDHESESEDVFDSLYGSDCDDCSERSSQVNINRSNSTSPVPSGDTSNLFKKSTVLPLSFLAAKVTGGHYPCQFLEDHNPPLDEDMIKKVAYWAFPQSESSVKIYVKLAHYKEDDWRDGETLIEEKRIIEIAQVGFMISAILSKPVFLTSEASDSTTITTKSKMEDAKVTVSFEKQKVTASTCSLCPKVIWCRHIVAVVIYRIRNSDKFLFNVHAPVTEVLSTLSRDQMQKLLHYAISEDPGGIICRVFKHMDTIRDSRSEINQMQGAPDPTFGICPDQKPAVDLTLTQLDQDFRDDIQRVSSIRYPDTCNFDEKAKTQIYRCYFQKVAELIGSAEIDSAGRVLINMANSTLNEINTQRQSMCINRLFHDIERLFTCFVASFKGQICEDLVQAAIDINSIIHSMDNSDEFVIASEWSDFGSIPLENYITGTCMSYHDNSSEGILGASRRAPFYQPVCASLIPEPPDSLEDLLCGRQKPLTTSYEEHLPVMLLRFEALMHFGTKKMDKKLYNLGVVILRKLLNLSRQFSVIGCNKVQEISSEVSSSETDESENESVFYAKKRIRKQKNRPKKKLCSVPRLETMEIDMEGMTKAQISYGLLFVCYTLYQLEDLLSLGLDGFPVILDATFRAMELGRFRAIAQEDTISVKDYSWLVFLDKKIQESYFKLSDCDCTIQTYQEQAVQKYTSALQEHQASFYGDHYAVGLLSFLIQDSLLSDKTAQMLSLEGACLSTCPLKKLTIPENPFDTTNDDDMKSRWTLIIKSIFSGFVDNKENNNTVVSKFLAFIESIDDVEYACLIYDVLKDYQKELTLLEQKISCIKFLLRLVKLCNKSEAGQKAMLCTSFVEVGLPIHLEFLSLILPDWQELCLFFHTEHLKKIIQVMKDVDNIPKEIIDMLLKYFEAPYKHDEECSEFLRFVHDRALRQDALQKVIYNYKNYTPTALLLLAKIEHNESESSILPYGDIFSENVFLLIQQAFRRLREISNESNEEVETFSVDLRVHLLWFFEKISDCGKFGTNYGNDIVKGSQFSTIMDDLAKTIRNDSQLLVSFFSEMKKSRPLFDRAKQVLGEHLIGNYQRRFQKRLRTCGRCSYEYVLQEMKEARNHCVQYVDNGSALFKRNVTDSIRRLHRGKKKFLQLMDSKFPELHQDF
ncbi:uncharacterized protein LOC132550321 [Ylistrum balloti]|uniref:uncharacterized protein LOC132550321 n=1 Tax=Ylistrum balloti TaxID=509963 RepID=UPI002905CB6D|nr:uncharacterized protein LOC132550321 [Ylistrum balloti]